MLRVRSGPELTSRFTKDYYVQWGSVAARGAIAARRLHAGRDAIESKMIDDGVSADAVLRNGSLDDLDGFSTSREYGGKEGISEAYFA